MIFHSIFDWKTRFEEFRRYGCFLMFLIRFETWSGSFCLLFIIWNKSRKHWTCNEVAVLDLPPHSFHPRAPSFFLCLQLMNQYPQASVYFMAGLNCMVLNAIPSEFGRLTNDLGWTSYIDHGCLEPFRHLVEMLVSPNVLMCWCMRLWFFFFFSAGGCSWWYVMMYSSVNGTRAMNLSFVEFWLSGSWLYLVNLVVVKPSVTMYLASFVSYPLV